VYGARRSAGVFGKPNALPSGRVEQPHGDPREQHHEPRVNEVDGERGRGQRPETWSARTLTTGAVGKCLRYHTRTAEKGREAYQPQSEEERRVLDGIAIIVFIVAVASSIYRSAAVP
jgi:hypothetical protein